VSVKTAKRKPGPVSARDFYASALDEAERLEFEAALGVQGLDQEIAGLRMRLRDVIAKRPEEVPLMLRGAGILARLVATKFRLGPGSDDLLQASLTSILDEQRRLVEGGKSDAGNGNTSVH
jgi:hypothetical protein